MIRTKPFAKQELSDKTEIEACLTIDLYELITNIEDFNELIHERLIEIGSGISLSEIRYSIVGHTAPNLNEQYEGSATIQVNAKIDSN